MKTITVKELISKLNMYPQSLAVLTVDNEGKPIPIEGSLTVSNITDKDGTNKDFVIIL